MNNFQKIQIDGTEYYIVDSIQNLRAEDSFIQPSNKLKFGTGSGEDASKYRKKILEYMPQCPFTKIPDERLLLV
jgi:hypothetical protein